MWVLLFLITVLIGMNDRKKMWILGSTFLITSAVVYLLFMVAWLNITLKMRDIAILRMIIAFIALIAGAINLNSYFKANESGCTVVESNKRKKIIIILRSLLVKNIFSWHLLV